MFKKLVIVSAVLAASSGVALAAHAYKGEMVPAHPICYTYNFYNGPYIGASLGVRNNYTGAPAVYGGLEGILSLGYSLAVSPMFYLAAELFAGDSFTFINYKSNDFVGVKSSWNYGLDIIPGVRLTDYVMAYFRGGVVRARFSDFSHTVKTGWRMGVGGQTALTPCWDLRAEYIYSSYSRLPIVGKPQSDQFNVGVVYRFM